MVKDWWLWLWVRPSLRQWREAEVVYGLMRAGEAYCAIFDKGLKRDAGHVKKRQSRKRKS